MKFETTIKEIRQETPDVKSFLLEKPKGFTFIPGQYCIVSLVGNKEYKGDSRPFTFSCSPNDSFLQLTVKEMTGFTKALHRLKPGDKIAINGPQGVNLNFDERIKRIVFLAGGSGITPFMSTLRHATSKKLLNKFILLFSNRTENDIIFKEELEKMKAQNKNIAVVNTLTDSPPKNWNGETGRISGELIQKYVKNPKEWAYYICGPPTMIKSMRETLKELGVESSKIIFEDWQLPGKGELKL